MKIKVFISYSSKDTTIADDICRLLESHGMICWIAPRNVDPGASEYASEIVKAIKACEVMVLVFSRHSNDSRHVASEIDLAFNYEKTIIPVLTDNTPIRDGLIYYLSRKHWLTAYPDYKSKYPEIVAAVAKQLGVNVTFKTNPGDDSKKSDKPAKKLDPVEEYTAIAIKHQNEEKYDEAIAYYFKALELMKSELGAEHPTTAKTYFNVGSIYFHQGDHDKALEYAFKALDIQEKASDTEDLDIALTFYLISVVYDVQQKYDKALEFAFKRITIIEKALGANHIDMAAEYEHIGEIYDDAARYAKALEYYKKASAIYSSSKNLSQYELKKFEILKERIKSTRESESRQQKIKKQLEKQREASELTKTAVRLNNNQQFSEALDYYFKVLVIEEEIYGATDLKTARTYRNIGVTYHNLGDFERAIDYYQKALDIQERKLGPNHETTQETRRFIELAKKAIGGR